MPRRIVGAAGAAALALSLLAGPVLAGQPNQSCEEQPMAPPGFSTGGFVNAQANYAGSGAASLSGNTLHAVSQYDVACYELSFHH